MNNFSESIGQFSVKREKDFKLTRFHTSEQKVIPEFSEWLFLLAAGNKKSSFRSFQYSIRLPISRLPIEDCGKAAS